ncbi:EAL domain-containing protein [Thiocapsa sp.]|uniref:EAL domain-containing protein n=1 Tax=Thiocapsa sp. TaxID=2024551 RepID=UPI003593274A
MKAIVRARLELCLQRAARNGFNFYEPAMSAGAAERLRMEHELRGALARNEMLLHDQPQAALSDCSLRDDEAIARAVIALGRSVGLDVIAEGIETRAQHDLLRDEFCDEGQGYVYGRPLAAAAFLESWSMTREGAPVQVDPTAAAYER